MVKFKSNHLMEETECIIPKSLEKKMQQKIFQSEISQNRFFKQKHKKAAQLRW